MAEYNFFSHAIRYMRKIVKRIELAFNLHWRFRGFNVHQKWIPCERALKLCQHGSVWLGTVQIVTQKTIMCPAGTERFIMPV